MHKKILKQYRIPMIGGFKEVLSQTAFYIMIINFTLIAVTAYNTTVREYVLAWLPDFKLWMFFGVLITMVLAGMILEYKFIIPSFYSFRSKQMFEHESQLMDKVTSIETLLKGKAKKPRITVAVSGGFDPIHPGHTAYIEGALELGSWLLVILTRDDQLIEKDRLVGGLKGRLPIPYEVRKAVIEWGLKGQGEVVENIDKDISSCQSLARYKPDIFAKGGNTWDIGNLPEKEVCDKLGIKIVFGVGGFGKPYSSSQLGKE